MADGGASELAAVDGARQRLRADCERCFALCCVAPAFSACSRASVKALSIMDNSCMVSLKTAAEPAFILGPNPT